MDFIFKFISKNANSRIVSSAFGVVINDKKYILTNAHSVLTNSKNYCKNKFLDKSIRLDLINKTLDLDLAIFEIKEQKRSFWNYVKLAKINNEFIIKEKVIAYRYSKDMENPFIDQGYISSLGHTIYSYGTPGVVIYAVITTHPGNSGGIVMNKKNEIIGCIFSADENSNCCIIPGKIINYYLECLGYTGLGFPGIYDIQANLVSDKINSGLIVKYISDTSPLIDYVKINDVILKINDKQINDYGSIMFNMFSEFNESENIPYQNLYLLPYWHYFRLRKPGDSVSLTIKRNNKKIKRYIFLARKFFKNTENLKLYKIIDNTLYVNAENFYNQTQVETIMFSLK